MRKSAARHKHAHNLGCFILSSFAYPMWNRSRILTDFFVPESLMACAATPALSACFSRDMLAKYRRDLLKASLRNVLCCRPVLSTPPFAIVKGAV
jgi:hypothetical protein